MKYTACVKCGAPFTGTYSVPVICGSCDDQRVKLLEEIERLSDAVNRVVVAVKRS